MTRCSVTPWSIERTVNKPAASYLVPWCQGNASKLSMRQELKWYVKSRIKIVLSIIFVIFNYWISSRAKRVWCSFEFQHFWINANILKFNSFHFLKQFRIFMCLLLLTLNHNLSSNANRFWDKSRQKIQEKTSKNIEWRFSKTCANQTLRIESRGQIAQTFLLRSHPSEVDLYYFQRRRRDCPETLHMLLERQPSRGHAFLQKSGPPEGTVWQDESSYSF